MTGRSEARRHAAEGRQGARRQRRGGALLAEEEVGERVGELQLLLIVEKLLLLLLELLELVLLLQIPGCSQHIQVGEHRSSSRRGTDWAMDRLFDEVKRREW